MMSDNNEEIPPKADTEEVAPNMEREKQDSGIGIGSIFYTKKPKHAGEGFGQGVGNALKGVVGGAAIFVGAPVAGFVQGKQEGGAWGAFKGGLAGLGMGAIGGVSMAASGVAVGAYQIARGIANTPGSISAASKGCDWDPETRKWVLYDLKEEAAIVLSMSDEDFLRTLNKRDERDGSEGGEASPGGTPGPKRVKRSVRDKEYYEVLNVPTDATPGEIKKAYYKKAKENHPDRHPDDPDAHAKFQKIGQAYQILSDEQLRENYDAGGKEGVDGAPKLDPGMMFAMIFGSDKFVPLVGELKLATQMQAKEEDEDNPQLDKFHQKKREVQIAVDLVIKLQPFIDYEENMAMYKESLAEEIAELSNTAFGKTLVACIGSMYKEEAIAELSALGAMGVGMQQAARGFVRGGSIVYNGAQAAWQANEMNKQHKEAVKRASIGASDKGGAAAAGADAQQKNNEEAGTSSEGGEEQEQQSKLSPDDEAALQKKMEKLSGHMFSVVWHLTEIDIRSTLQSVIKKVTHDHSVDEKMREKRCRALKALGEIFLEHGGNMEDGLAEVKARLQDQMKAEKAARSDSNNDEDKDGSKNSSSSSSSSSSSAAPQKPAKPAAAAPTNSEGDLD